MPRRVFAVVAFLLSALCLLPLAGALADVAGNERAFTSAIAQERAQAGLADYSVAGDLVLVARRQAQRMAAEGRLHHNPNLREEVENWDAVGENVGKGETVAEIHQAFMESASHRREILSSTFTEVGVGVVESDGLIWVSQVFRKPTPAPTAATPAPAVAAPPPAPSSGAAAPTAPRTVRSPAPSAVRPPAAQQAAGAAPLETAAPDLTADLEALAAAFRAAEASGPPAAPRVLAVAPEATRERAVATPVALASGLLVLVVTGLTAHVATSLAGAGGTQTGLLVRSRRDPLLRLAG